MKQFILLCVLLVSFLGLSAQNSTRPKVTPVPTPKVVSPHLKVFERARLLGDGATVLTSLNYLIASDPVQYGSYADTLAQVYFNLGNYLQCKNMTTLLLQSFPEKESLMALRAASLRELKQTAESADWYSRLYYQTRNFRYGLELAQLQLSLQRLPEMHATTDALLAAGLKPEDKVSVPSADDKNMEQVPVKNFIHYLKALAYNTAKEKELALSYVTYALNGVDTFSLAESAKMILSQPQSVEKK